MAHNIVQITNTYTLREGERERGRYGETERERGREGEWESGRTNVKMLSRKKIILVG